MMSLSPYWRIKQTQHHDEKGINQQIEQNQRSQQHAMATHLTFLHGAIQKV